MQDREFITDDSHLYEVLLAVILEYQGQWVSSHTIINHPRVKPFVEEYGPKRPSNYLGNMFRRGVIRRESATLHVCSDGSRYVYSVDAPQKSSLLVNKSNLKIMDDGKYVVIDTPAMRITIEQK